MKVPLFKQQRNSCGTTALRMTLSFYGKEISEAEAIKGIGGLKRYGVLTVKLAEFARKLGFFTHCISYNKKLADKYTEIKKPDTKYVLDYLRKNIPVIVNVNYSLLNNIKISDQGHFIVLTKYNNGYFWYNDPNDGKEHKIKEEEFRFAWFCNVLNSSAYLLAVWLKKKL